MATLQVKGMDPALYEALKARAKRDCRTVSQEVTYIVQQFLSRPGYSPRESTDAFIAMAGTWEDGRSAEEIVKELRASRRSRSAQHNKMLEDAFN